MMQSPAETKVTNLSQSSCTKQALGRSSARTMSPVKMFQIITLGVPVDLPVREQVAASSLQTLTQLTACLASIVNRKLQSGKDQIRRRRSKHPETITSFDVSKSDTGMQKKVEIFLVAKYALLLFFYAFTKLTSPFIFVG